jgi:hypothetical protein
MDHVAGDCTLCTSRLPNRKDKSMKRSLLLVLLTLVVGIALVTLASKTTFGPQVHDELELPRIYAYKGWQSIGLRVHEGDVIHIRAEGSWMYTPDEYHGPEGHPRYPSPSFYPIPNIPGGALIGRIGEHGEPFYVGRRYSANVREDGTLYLRINDDLLGDNGGYVTVRVTVIEPEDNE